MTQVMAQTIIMIMSVLNASVILVGGEDVDADVRVDMLCPTNMMTVRMTGD